MQQSLKKTKNKARNQKKALETLKTQNDQLQHSLKHKDDEIKNLELKLLRL